MTDRDPTDPADPTDRWKERAGIAEQRAELSEQRADVSEHRADASERRADAQEVLITAQNVTVEASQATLADTRDALRAVMQEITELRETMQTVYLSKQEVEAQFPDRREVTRRRRLSLAILGTILFSFIQAHDVHVEECGPGARTERIIDTFLHEPDPPETLDERLRSVGSKPTSVVCDMSFPTHKHDELATNNGGQAVGFAIYGGVMLAVIVWYRRA